MPISNDPIDPDPCAPHPDCGYCQTQTRIGQAVAEILDKPPSPNPALLLLMRGGGPGDVPPVSLRVLRKWYPGRSDEEIVASYLAKLESDLTPDQKRIIDLHRKIQDLVDLTSVRLREIKALTNWHALGPGAKVKFDLIRGDMQDVVADLDAILASKKE